MNGILFIIMIVVLGVMTMKNINKAKTLKKDKAYVDAYMKVLKSEEDANTNLKNYIETEKDNELKHRAKIVLVYEELLNGNDPSELVSSISYNAALLNNGKVDLEKLCTNSDTFVWLDMDLALANKKGYLHSLTPLYEGLNLHDDELNNVVEYELFKAIYNYLDSGKEEYLEFPKRLLCGDYVGMKYDKQLIGVSKKLAAALLSYGNQPLDEGCIDFLKEFATTQVGNKFMDDLGIKDKYAIEKVDKWKLL